MEVVGTMVYVERGKGPNIPLVAYLSWAAASRTTIWLGCNMIWLGVAWSKGEERVADLDEELFDLAMDLHKEELSIW